MFMPSTRPGPQIRESRCLRTFGTNERTGIDPPGTEAPSPSGLPAGGHAHDRVGGDQCLSTKMRQFGQRNPSSQIIPPGGLVEIFSPSSGRRERCAYHWAPPRKDMEPRLPAAIGGPHSGQFGSIFDARLSNPRQPFPAGLRPVRCGGEPGAMTVPREGVGLRRPVEARGFDPGGVEARRPHGARGASRAARGTAGPDVFHDLPGRV